MKHFFTVLCILTTFVFFHSPVESRGDKLADKHVDDDNLCEHGESDDADNDDGLEEMVSLHLF